MRASLLCGVMIGLLVASSAGVDARGNMAQAKRRQRARHASICSNPNEKCRTSATFEPYDLPFRLPQNAVIYDTEMFYAIILKSVRAKDDDCGALIPETERLAAQALFPDHKVFASRCTDAGTLFYTGVSPNQQFMAVYAGATRAEAARMLAAVKATGKFAGANLRQMRAGFNGT